jgi:hypothetical protein
VNFALREAECLLELLALLVHELDAYITLGLMVIRQQFEGSRQFSYERGRRIFAALAAGGRVA